MQEHDIYFPVAISSSQYLSRSVLPVAYLLVICAVNCQHGYLRIHKLCVVALVFLKVEK